MRVLCDMDSVIAALDVKWYGMANADCGTNITTEDITDWDTSKFFPCGKKIFDYLATPGFFRDLPVIDGAREGLKAIHDAGHEILVVSTCVFPSAKADKTLWLAENFPFLAGKLITCDAKVPKDAVRGDVLIDDGPHNILGYRAAYPNAKIITFDYPYNRHAQNAADLVAGSFKYMASAWQRVAGAVLHWGPK